MKEDNAIQPWGKHFSSDRPLLTPSETRRPMLLSIGEKLRVFYEEEVSSPLPRRLETLLQDLMKASRKMASPGGA